MPGTKLQIRPVEFRDGYLLLSAARVTVCVPTLGVLPGPQCHVAERAVRLCAAQVVGGSVPKLLEKFEQERRIAEAAASATDTDPTDPPPRFADYFEDSPAPAPAALPPPPASGSAAEVALGAGRTQHGSQPGAARKAGQAGQSGMAKLHSNGGSPVAGSSGGSVGGGGKEGGGAGSGTLPHEIAKLEGAAAMVAPDETVISLHPPFPLVGALIWMERECQ